MLASARQNLRGFCWYNARRLKVRFPLSQITRLGYKVLLMVELDLRAGFLGRTSNHPRSGSIGSDLVASDHSGKGVL